MRKLLLLGFLLAAVSAAMSVQYKPTFQANMSNGGAFTFPINKTLYSISVSAGPSAQLSYRELSGVSRPPDNVVVYKYVEISRENAVSDIVLVFAVPNNWLKNHGASVSDVVIMKREDGDWVELKRYHEAEDLLRQFFRVRTETLSTFAIGVRDYGKIASGQEAVAAGCAAPTEWSECLSGKRSRTVEELVDGNCLPRNEVEECPVELGVGRSPLVTVVVLAMIAMVGLLGYPIVKDKGKSF